MPITAPGKAQPDWRTGVCSGVTGSRSTPTFGRRASTTWDAPCSRLSCTVNSASGPLASTGVTWPPLRSSSGSNCACTLLNHLARQFSRALWLTHLLMRCVMRGAQATSTQWRATTLLASGASSANCSLAYTASST